MTSLDTEKETLLSYIVQIEQNVTFMKHYFFRIGERNQLVCGKLEKLASKAFPKDSAQCYVIHPILPDAIPMMNVTLTEMTKELRTLSSRTGTVCAQDLLTFLEGWKVVKALAKKLAKENTKKNIENKSRLFPRADDLNRTKVEQDIMFQTKKEIESLEEKILFQLKDLHTCLIDFCHAQLYYHAKGLEHWSRVWNVLKKKDLDSYTNADTSLKNTNDILSTMKSNFETRPISQYTGTRTLSKKTKNITLNEDDDAGIDDEIGQLEKELKMTNYGEKKE